MLPANSGIEVAEDLRSAVFPTLPMIGMSASVIMRDLARLSGAFEVVLNKPFDLTVLLAAVDRLIPSGYAHAPVLAVP
jgi:CheY-like chemotaxis protein